MVILIGEIMQIMAEPRYQRNRGIFNDPIYGHIYYHKSIEEPIINDLALQRLRYIRQLQFAYLVYPGADHTRFQHSIGTMHLSSLLFNSIVSKMNDEVFKEICRSDDNYGKYNLKEVYYSIRLTSLLHDIGHGPYGHAFDRYILEKFKINHEDITYIIYQNRIRRIIQQNIKDKNGINSLNIVNLVDQLLTTNLKDIDRCSLFFRAIVKDWFMPADILDFLLRDSFYTGTLEYGWINYERLIDALEIINFNGYYIPALNWKSKDEFRKYVLARQLMYERVYLHPGVRAFEFYFGKLANNNEILDKIGIINAIEKLVKHNCIEDYLYVNEFSLFSNLLNLYKRINVVNDLSKESKKVVKDFVETIYLRRKSKWKLVRELRKTVYSARNLREDDYINGVKAELRNIALAIRDTLIKRKLINNEDILIDDIDGPLLFTVLPTTSFKLMRGISSPIIPFIIRTNGDYIPVFKVLREFMREFNVYPIVSIRVYINRNMYKPEIIKLIYSINVGRPKEGINKWVDVTS